MNIKFGKKIFYITFVSTIFVTSVKYKHSSCCPKKKSNTAKGKGFSGGIISVEQKIAQNNGRLVEHEKVMTA